MSNMHIMYAFYVIVRFCNLNLVKYPSDRFLCAIAKMLMLRNIFEIKAIWDRCHYRHQLVNEMPLKTISRCCVGWKEHSAFCPCNHFLI